MCFEDAVHYFEDCCICKVNDDYQDNYSFMSSTHAEGGFSLIRFKVKGNGGHTYLTINQKDKRCFKKSAKYKYQACHIIVVKIEDLANK